jgi:hypothetical protein
MKSRESLSSSKSTGGSTSVERSSEIVLGPGLYLFQKFESNMTRMSE